MNCQVQTINKHLQMQIFDKQLPFENSMLSMFLPHCRRLYQHLNLLNFHFQNVFRHNSWTGLVSLLVYWTGLPFLCLLLSFIDNTYGLLCAHSYLLLNKNENCKQPDKDLFSHLTMVTRNSSAFIMCQVKCFLFAERISNATHQCKTMRLQLLS